MRVQFYEAAMIAAMQALIQNNPGISCKFAAKKAQEYAEQSIMKEKTMAIILMLIIYGLIILGMYNLITTII